MAPLRLDDGRNGLRHATALATKANQSGALLPVELRFRRKRFLHLSPGELSFDMIRDVISLSLSFKDRLAEGGTAGGTPRRSGGTAVLLIVAKPINSHVGP